VRIGALVVSVDMLRFAALRVWLLHGCTLLWDAP
jgi:hypothetical protein